MYQARVSFPKPSEAISDSTAVLILKCKGVKHPLSGHTLRAFILKEKGEKGKEDKKTQVILI